MKLIKVEHAYKIYKNGTTAVADLSVSIDKGEFVFAGDCVNLYKDRILKNKNFEITPACLNSCISKNACVIGKHKFESGDISDCFNLSPEYVRLSQAQRDMENKGK